MKSEDEVSDDFEQQFSENAGANPDPNVVAELSGPYENWPSFVKGASATPTPS